MKCLHEFADGEDGLVAAHLPVAAEQLPGVDVGDDDELGEASPSHGAAQARQQAGEDVLDPGLVGAPAVCEARPDALESPLLGESPKDEIAGPVVVVDQGGDCAFDVTGLDVVATRLNLVVDPLERGAVERFLRAEVVDDRLQRDIRRPGNLTESHVLVPRCEERVTGRLEDPLSGHLDGRRACRHSIDSRTSH